MNNNNINNNEISDVIDDYRSDLKELIISKALIIKQKYFSESYSDIFKMLFLMPETNFLWQSFL